MSEAYEIVLIVHSFVRWWVIVASAATSIHSFWPRQGGASGAFEPRVGRAFALDRGGSRAVGLPEQFVPRAGARNDQHAQHDAGQDGQRAGQQALHGPPQLKLLPSAASRASSGAGCQKAWSSAGFLANFFIACTTFHRPTVSA